MFLFQTLGKDMLQKLSDGAKGGFSKFLLVGLLFLAVAGLVLSDVGGFFRDGISSTSVADVGRESVPYQEFDRFARNMLSRMNLTPQDAYPMGQVHELLDRYVQDILIVQAASKLGVRIPDEAIAAQVHKFVEPHMIKGQSPQETLNQLLAQQGLRESDFVEALRRDITTSMLQGALVSGAPSTPRILAVALSRYQSETRDINYIVFKDADIDIKSAPSEEEQKKFYELSKAEYRIPERRQFKIAILDSAIANGEVEVSDEMVSKYYADNKSRYEIPAGRQIEQAIFPSKEEANKVFEDYKADLSLAEQSGSFYKGKQVFQKETAAPALSEAIFKDDTTGLRTPFETPFGWHLINVIGDVDVTFTPFEIVKDAIRKELEQEERSEIIRATLDDAVNRIDDGAHLDELVRDFKMESQDLGPIDQFGMNAENQNGLKSYEKDSADILENLFSLYEDEISQAIELTDGRFAFLKITEIIPESYQSFESVKDKIAERLIQNERRSTNQKKVQDYLSELQNDKIKLTDIAIENKLLVKTAKGIQRDQNEFKDGDVSIDIKSRLFDADAGSYVVGANPEGLVIAQSVDSRLLPVALDDEKMKPYEQLEVVQVLSTYLDHLKATIPVTINDQLLQQLYAPVEN